MIVGSPIAMVSEAYLNLSQVKKEEMITHGHGLKVKEVKNN